MTDHEKFFWRVYLRLFQSADQWHNRRFPPSFEAHIGEKHVELQYRGRNLTLRRAETLQTRFRGGCHLLLSGPSVGTIRDPVMLKHSFLIGVNGSPRIIEESGAGVDLYILDDPGFVRRRGREVLRHAERATHTLVNYGIAAELLAGGLELPNGVIVDSVDAPFRRARPPAGAEVVFSRSFSAGLKSYGTVAYLALQAAYCLGFREVKIFGLDLTSGGRYYAERRPEPSRLQADFLDGILRPFRYVGAMVAASEWLVENCSPRSRLPSDVLPRRDPNAALLDGFAAQPAAG